MNIFYFIDVPAYGPAKLPNYEQATTLPSYEEAERTKEQDAANVSEIENGRVSMARLICL